MGVPQATCPTTGEKDAPNAVAFSRPADAKPYAIVLRVPAAIQQICNAMGWQDKTKYHSIPGQLFYGR